MCSILADVIEARPGDLEQKEERLRTLFRSLGSAIIAYSGGVDSAYVAFIAARVLGERPTAPVWPRAIARKPLLSLTVSRSRTC